MYDAWTPNQAPRDGFTAFSGANTQDLRHSLIVLNSYFRFSPKACKVFQRMMHYPKHYFKRCFGRYLRSRPLASALLTLAAISLTLPVNASPHTQADAKSNRITNSHYGWDCQPKGEGWDCHETLIPGLGGNQSGNHLNAIITAQSQLHHLDWVAEKYLTDEQKQQLGNSCCGLYIEPKADYADATLKPEDAPIRASADRSEYLNANEARLQGDVVITQGYRQMQADQITLNQAAEQATLEGDVKLREPGMLLMGERGHIDMAKNTSQLDQAEFVLHQTRLRGNAKKLEKLGDKIVLLTDGGVTSCEPDSNTWFLKGSEIELNQETHIGTATHVRLNIKDIPIFYLPYMTFPLGDERKSGFLIPSISSSNSNGIELAAPYYLNLAPNYDATISPRYLSERGLLTELETRHLSRYFATTLAGSYLDNDKGGNISDADQQLIDDGTITEAEAQPYKDEARWLINLDQRGGIGQRWFTDINYSEVSDQDFMRDLDTQSLEVNSRTHLLQRAATGYNFNHWTLRAKAEQYQVLSTVAEQYRQLPNVELDGYYRFGNIELTLLNDVTRFDHIDKDDNINRITGDRGRADYKIDWNNRWVWGHLKPSIGASTLYYQLNQQNLKSDADAAPSATAAMASLDAGLNFERDGNLFGNPYLQTFEPRLFHLYREYDKNQAGFYDLTKNNADINFDTTAPTFSYAQLFRDSRFVGSDRLDDANQTSIGLTTRFISASSGAERLRLSLGQIFYHQDRKINLNNHFDNDTAAACDPDSPSSICRINRAGQSEIAAQISGQLSNSWRFTGDLLYDPYTDDLIEESSRYDDSTSAISRASIGLRYLDDNYNIFNLAYRFSRAPMVVDTGDINNNGDSSELIDGNIEQLDASAVLPIAGNWNLIARSLYDINYQRELETFAGFEYDSCCYRFRLVARKWLDNTLYTVVPDQNLEHDQGVFFEIQFKGLGDTGKQVSNILNDGILNYSRRDQALNTTPSLTR